MSIAYMKVKGLTYYDSKIACTGVTLLTPSEGTGLWLIDMLGTELKQWEMGYKPSSCGELLPNGHLLYTGKNKDSPLAELEGAGGIMIEIDWYGNKVWEYQDPYLHHAFYRMESGNTLVLKWVPVPEKIAIKIEGGLPGSERQGVIWGDVIQEVTSKGKVVWEWVAHEHFDSVSNAICPFCHRSTWHNITSVVELPDGNIVANLRKTSTLIVIDKKSGKVLWQWGTNELAHPYYLSVLDNANILLFDDGLHAYAAHGCYSRALEVNIKTSKMVWSYGDFGEISRAFYSPLMSNCQRLPNGQTLVCEGRAGRVFEISGNGEPIWEYINAFPSEEKTPSSPKFYPLYGAYRYETSYSGLERPISLPEARQAAPATLAPAVAGEEAVRSRLSALGY